ncbi:hypothetical protein FQA39_LY18164 [Lamprigera yunnana]|nr:hypothetical protein FQA39_LY18164 [Lamprigera yunnana]
MPEYKNNLNVNDRSSNCEESDSGSDIVVRKHRVMQILSDSDDNDDNNYFSDTEDVPDCENIDVNLAQFTCLPTDTQYNKQTPNVFFELPGPKHTPPGLCEEFGISIEPPKQMMRKHIFGDGSIIPGLSNEENLKRTLDKVPAEIQERFQQLVISRVDDEEYNLKGACEDIDREEFKLECGCLKVFLASTDCEKELIDY